MNDSPMRSTDGETGVGARLSELLLEARFAQAVNLARAGHYSEAENLLASMPQEENTTSMRLDLLARIRAQQGRLLEAEALWVQASQLVSGKGAFQAGLDRIARLQKRPVRVARVLSGVAVLMIVSAAALLAWKVTRELDAVRSMVLELRDKSPASAPGRPPFATGLEAQLRVPGISFRKQENALVATFEAGLFARGTVLSASAAKLLTEFGRKLEARAEKVSVEITGCTDDSPVPARGKYSDNSALGIRRAVTVVEHLRKTTRLPERLLLVRAGGEANAPYPNDSPANRARNRTVTIRISPVE